MGSWGTDCVVAAHLIAAAIEHRQTFVDLAFGEYAELFEATRRDLLCRYPPCLRRLPAPRWLRAGFDRLATLALRIGRLAPAFGPWLRVVVWREVEVEYRLDSPAFADLVQRSRVLLLEGWTFRTDAVRTHADAIRAHFTPASPYLARIEARAAALRAQAEVLVGVHVRLGDYATWLGGRYLWPIAAYAELMRRVLGLFPGRRVLFVVCSNEAIDSAALSDLPHVVLGEDAVLDMYTLARCDYLLGPPSSFSLWASFYGNVPLWVVQEPDGLPRLEEFVPRLV